MQLAMPSSPADISGAQLKLYIQLLRALYRVPSILKDPFLLHSCFCSPNVNTERLFAYERLLIREYSCKNFSFARALLQKRCRLHFELQLLPVIDPCNGSNNASGKRWSKYEEPLNVADSYSLRFDKAVVYPEGRGRLSYAERRADVICVALQPSDVTRLLSRLQLDHGRGVQLVAHLGCHGICWRR